MKHKAARKTKTAHVAKSAVKNAHGKRVKAAAAAKVAARKPKAKKPDVPPKPDALDAIITGSAKALGLRLDPAWHDSIKFNLQLVFRHAALVDEFPLPDDAEPAPVFHA
ncbi:MAG TPA: DUF4089 domain-containing protein [Xanthobacteraceae bacterium]|jgi:hypothetical protein|nr:DUF4089 domain-containing protein [Xanthobacteraceae bacterium]